MLLKFTDRTTARTARAGLLFSGIGLLLGSPVFGGDAASCAPAPTCAAAPACAKDTDCNECAKNYEEARKNLANEYNRLQGESLMQQQSCCDTAATCDGTGCAGEAACEEEPCFKLHDLLCGDCESPYEVAGWVDMGYQSDHDGAFTGNGPFLDDHEWKDFQFNQVYLYSQKVANGECGWDWGYRADVFYGTDGNEGQAFGNNPGIWDFQNGFDHGIYEWAIPQLYAEVAYDKTSVKVGHFYTIVGYEVVPATGNFFYSKQITFYNAEPFTHTGALVTQKVSDDLSVSAGYVLGWDTGFDQFFGGEMALVGATYTINEDSVLTYYGSFGDSGWRGDAMACQGIVYTQNWTDKWSTAHQFDVMNCGQAGNDFQTNGIVQDSTGFINYAFYEINDTLKAGTRVEWFKADSTSYYTWTYGVNIKAASNVMIRPEVRHMWAPGAVGGPAGSIARNINDVYGNATVFGIDAVVTF
jgi:hypothetical protein